MGPLQASPSIQGRDGGYSGVFAGRSVWLYGDTVLSFEGEDGMWYEFYTIAMDIAGNVETESDVNDTWTHIVLPSDSTPPTSTITGLSGEYWYTDPTVEVTWTADDDIELASVALEYNYSEDNASWDGWMVFETNDTIIQDEDGVFIFDWPAGEGFYRFITNATDAADNPELDLPGEYDALAGYDVSAPNSSANPLSSTQSSLMVYVSYTHQDNVSGISAIELWVSNSTNGTSTKVHSSYVSQAFISVSILPALGCSTIKKTPVFSRSKQKRSK